MVTRVDKKPIIYNSTLIRVWRPAVTQGRKTILAALKEKSVGHAIPDVSASQLLEDFDDIDTSYKMYGLDDPWSEIFGYMDDEESDECIRLARVMIDRSDSRLMLARHDTIMQTVVSVQNDLIASVDRIYYGTEAVYKLWNQVINDNVFEYRTHAAYEEWSKDVAEQVLTMQGPYMFIHPSGIQVSVKKMADGFGYISWGMWHKYKKTETLLIRIGSRKNFLAHAHYSGMRAGGFEPNKKTKEDFRMPTSGYAETIEGVEFFAMMGVKYILVGNEMYVLAPDDCINISTMAQAHFRTAMYFQTANDYSAAALGKSIGLLKDLTNHCCRLIDTRNNFSNIIRSIHILAQKDFNDVWEDEKGADLGWRERSINYDKEADELDKMGRVFHGRILGLANCKADEMNVGFFYHAFIGDEMLIADLRSKVKNMPGKVLNADAEEWKGFIEFSKAYFLARFMYVYKRKPKVGGEVVLMNGKWADRCLGGRFTMPPMDEWGRVQISGEFTWTGFANTWHLEAQDVAYVPKDSAGLVAGDYRSSNLFSSELLMAMTSGEILDTLTNSTPIKARNRIKAGTATREVVLTTAPKAENAKPTWKKRVTFAADCEFRKMQSEFDRNCRKVMSFVRGPSLAVDQHILEGQFKNITDATILGLGGAICSHDISAWSESMDRERKFEFENILVTMLSEPTMINIKNDWAKIRATVLKQGTKDVVRLPNGSFQGFDGSTSTILHSMILIYCMETGRRKGIISKGVKTDMATLIDDCVALMKDLDDPKEANAFWTHLKETYKRLGFEVDELKSIFSTIKAIYLSRRFLYGAEVPADMKVFIKAHSSYEDPLRCATDVVPDIFGAARGACDANGDPWFIYYTTVVTTLAELAHQVPKILELPPGAAAVIALAPSVENGWSIPSMIDWCTNDVMDKRTHYNAIIESAAFFDSCTDTFRTGILTLNVSAVRMFTAIKSQPWRIVSLSNVFTNPFEAIREGPLKPDMLRRNAVSDLLKEVITSEPWVSLMRWNTSYITNKVRSRLIASGCLHAPTLAALVNCMPDNYRLGMVGKAVGSNSLLNILPRGMKVVLKRRVIRCATNYYEFAASMFSASHESLDSSDIIVMSHVSRSVMEREAFYALNGVDMIDHTFPDPIQTFTNAKKSLGSVIGPNASGLRTWDPNMDERRNVRLKHWVSNKGSFVPSRSGRVWEVTSEYARGWDSVSQRIAMGLAILARAAADGHKVGGLVVYFTKAWNEDSDITPEDTGLIAIHGSMKRLDSNPGSANHPIIAHRNCLSGVETKLKSAIDVLSDKAKEITGVASHLHDPLTHMAAMRCATILQLAHYGHLGCIDMVTRFDIATRPDCVIPASTRTMDTDKVASIIGLEIADSFECYSLLQACPTLAHAILIPTMRTGWIEMINALMSGDHKECNDIMERTKDQDINFVIDDMGNKKVVYSTNVVRAQEPITRHSVHPDPGVRYSMIAQRESARTAGDSYTLAVRSVASKYAKDLVESQPEHIVAAVAIKSVVWDRIKTLNLTMISKVFYQDPDADYSVLDTCRRSDFWRGVVTEVNRVKKSKILSEMVVSGFRSLGVHGIRILSSNDQKEVTQAVASYFGSHMREIPRVVLNDLLHLTGRRAGDYDSPIITRVITNNPALENIRIKKDHIRTLVNHNLKILDDRITELEKKEAEERKDMHERVEVIVKHRGDARHPKVHGRLVELRNRRAVYHAVDIDNEGRATVNYAKVCKYLIRASQAVKEKHDYDIDIPDEDVVEDSAVLEDSFDYSQFFQEEADREMASTGRKHGWSATYGKIGLTYANQIILADAEKVFTTKFALTPAEIAPRIHRKILVSDASEPDPEPAAAVIHGGMGYDSDEDDYVDIDSYLAIANQPVRPVRLKMEAWKALFTLIHCNAYSAADVNAKLGTDIPRRFDLVALQDSNLSDFSDDFIYEAFPRLNADYIGCGSQWEVEWEDKEETDAYTIEELGRGRGGSLF